MSGEELKAKVLETKVPFSEIASRLGITAQSLNSCFKGKDVRSNTIERIADTLGVKMSYFYPMEDGNSAVASSGGIAVSGNHNDVNKTAASDSDVLRERVAMLERLLEEKDKLLEEKERTIQIFMKK